MTIIPMPDSLLMAARDAGLRRHVGAWAFAAAIVNGVVGAGIFSLPAAMARSAGDRAPWAYAICGLAMGLVVLCLAEAGSRMPTSGGVYGYVTDTFGPRAGFVSGMLTWMASVLACGGIADAFAATVGGIAPALAGGAGRAAVILATLGGITAVNLRGVRLGAGLVSIATVIKLLPLLLLVALGLAVWPAHAAAPDAAPRGGFADAIILAAFAFSGMETVLGASGEVADAPRALPRALFGAMGFVLLLYVALQLVTAHLLGADLARSAAPLADAAGRIAPPLRVLLVAGGALSMLGWIGSDILGAPRLLFAFARDGLLPAPLGHAGARTGVPDIAIVAHAVLAAVLAISGSFRGLVVTATLNTAALYVMGCAAAWVLHRRGTRTLGPAVSFRVLPVAACLGMATMLLLIGVAPREQVLGLGAVLVGSGALYSIMRWRTAGMGERVMIARPWSRSE